MRYCLDEDLSPRIAELLRKTGIDAMSIHEVGRAGLPDDEQLDFAGRERRCLVTRNRDDFLRLTLRFLADRKPHRGVLIVPYTIPADAFSRIARALKAYAKKYPDGLPSCTMDFVKG